MKLLEVLSRKEERKVYRVKGANCIYKVEKGNLYVGNIYFKTWYESEMKVNDLMKIEVEELAENKISRKMFKGETYYFINDEGSIVEDEEDFSIVDDNRYEFGNYFESKEEAEECRELIIKTIKAFKINRNKEKEKACKVLIEKTLEAFKGRNMSKREREEELEKEFEDIESIEISKYYGKIISLNKNYTSLEDFENKKDCLYIDVNGRNIALSMEDWEKLNQYVEKLRKFK